MTFELESLTKVRVLDVRVLSKKDRKPDESPGAQLLMQATLSCGVLSMFDGFLSGMLFRKPTAKKQGELEGVESAELSSIGEHVKRLRWVYEQTGCTVAIDFGIGGPSNLLLTDCLVHRVSFAPQAGGAVGVQWTVDAPALSDETRGKLTGLKSTDVQMSMHGPEADPQQEIESDKPSTKRAGKKGSGVIDGANTDGTWPFPKKDGAAAAGDGLTPEKALANSMEAAS